MNNVEDFISSLSCFVPLELVFFVMRVLFNLIGINDTICAQSSNRLEF